MRQAGHKPSGKEKQMTLRAWEKTLTPDRIAQLEKTIYEAEAARERDETTAWEEYCESDAE